MLARNLAFLPVSVHDSNPFPEMEIELLLFLLRESEQNILLTVVQLSDSCNFPYLKSALQIYFEIYIEYRLITEVILKDVSIKRQMHDGGKN